VESLGDKFRRFRESVEKQGPARPPTQRRAQDDCSPYSLVGKMCFLLKIKKETGFSFEVKHRPLYLIR